MINRWSVSMLLIMAALLAAACGGTDTASLPEPAGAAQGLPTLIFYYTDG